MADQLNTEEFQRQLEIILDLMKRGIPLSEDQVRALASSTKAQKQYTDEVNAQNAAFNKLGRGTKELGQSMLNGKRGMEAMTGGVNAVAGAAEMIIALIPGMRLFKIALTAVVNVLTFFSSATMKQADALFKTYQDLSKTGQATAGGMVDIYKNMQQFGYNIEELDKMSALLKDSSQALASFGGTAAAGGKAFANAAEQIQRSDLGKTFQMMGMLPDDINRGMAMYIKSQQAIGIRNTDINKNLSDSAGKYVMQLDLLSKLTGLSADQAQEKLDQANAEQAFNQVQYELKKKYLAGDEAAGKQFVENQILATTLTGTMLKEFQQGLGGDISAFSKTMMLSGEAVGMMASGTFKATAVLNSLGQGADQVRDFAGGLARMNAADFVPPYAEISQVQSRFGAQTAELQQKQAEAQQLLQKTGLEPTTKRMTEMQIVQMNTTAALQNLINVGIDPVTDAMAKLGRVLNYITSFLPGTKSGVSGQIGGGGGGAGGGGAGGGAGGGGAGGGAGGGGAGGLGAVGKGTDFGLRLKPGAENNGASTDTLYGVAAKVHEMLGGNYLYFSGLNDRSSKDSSHSQGRAFDLVLNDPTRYAGVLAQIQAMDQVKFAQFEPLGHRNSNGSVSTGDHIHTEVSARNGFKGLLSGPSSGYMPNIEMHGREQLSITPANAGSTANLMGAESADMMKKQLEKLDQVVQGINQAGAQNIMAMQLDRLDELVRVMQNQVNVSTKILQQSR